MVDEIGPENVVHAVTDNGSNYKKACKELREVYEHIAWTPCLAHTVNLMLKDIARRPEHGFKYSKAAVPCHEACFTMLFVQWMRAELEYFCLAAYKGSQSVVAQET